MAEENYFSAKIFFVKNYQKMSTLGPTPKIGLNLVTYVHNIIS